MKRHFGKILGALGLVFIFVLAPLVGPWISDTFFTSPVSVLPNGDRVIVDLAAHVQHTAAGQVICVWLGFALLVAGAVVSVVQAFKTGKKKQPNQHMEDTVA